MSTPALPPAAVAALAEIEAAWPAAVADRVAAVAAARPGETVYAAGFWCRYMDYTVLAPPAVAVNTEEHESASDGRWFPSEWADDCAADAGVLEPLYQKLCDALPATEDENGDDLPEAEAVWDAALAAADAVLCRVCGPLTAAARRPPRRRAVGRPAAGPRLRRRRAGRHPRRRGLSPTGGGQPRRGGGPPAGRAAVAGGVSDRFAVATGTPHVVRRGTNAVDRFARADDTRDACRYDTNRSGFSAGGGRAGRSPRRGAPPGHARLRRPPP